MKILVISATLYPTIGPRAFRTTELVRELARQGHDVTLYINVIDGAQYQYCKDNNIVLKSLGKFKFVKPKKKITNFFSQFAYYLRRVCYILFEYPFVEYMYRVKKSLSNEKDYDLLISIAVPHPIHWGVAWSLKSNGKSAKKWIADCGDAYMGADFDRFNHPFYMGYLERWFCRKADWITIPNIAMKQNFYPEFGDKFKEITQGFNFEEDRSTLPKYEKNKIPTFLFSGSFIAGVGNRDPRPFLEFLISIEDPFKFYIYTPDPALIQSIVDRSKNRIKVKSYIPREEIIKVQASMDFLINIGYNPGRQLPSKLIDYYIVQRPILNIIDDNIDVETKLMIKEFLKGDYSKKLRHDNIDQYKIENVAKKFLTLANEAQ